MKNTRYQRGSAHAIIIVLIVLVVLGVLGFVFWQHFLVKSKDQSPTPKSSAPKSQQAYTRGIVQDESSNIWAGYVASGTTFTSVEGRTKIPKVSCTSSEDTYAVWTGFDGYGGSGTVEQAGVTADCADDSHFVNAKPIDGVTYYAWTMMFGAGGNDVFDLSIHPGDTIFYKVSYAASNFDMTVTDETTKQTANKSYTCQLSGNQGPDPCARAMAEWIVERAGNGSLAKFGSAYLYDNKATTDDGRTLNADQFATYRLSMAQNGVTLAEPGTLATGGNFLVTWLASGTAGE